MSAVFYVFVAFVATSGWILLFVQKRKLNSRIKKLEFEQIEFVVDSQNLHSESTSHKEMERLSIVAKQTENAIMIMDPSGNIEWVNEGFTRLYGYSYDEFIKKLGSNIRQTSFSDAIEERLHRCCNLGQSVSYEALNITKTGDSIWTHTSLTPIYDDNGKLAYLATIDSDISRRKESGDELLKAIEQLSSKINNLSEQQNILIAQTTKMMNDIQASEVLLEESDYIVKFINEVSDKIKILGLNASIEAATMNNRNGSSVNLGNGFRVIAGEIIKLSDDSKKHATRISDVMKRLQSAFDSVVSNKDTVSVVSSSFFNTLSAVRKELIRVERVADKLNS